MDNRISCQYFHHEKYDKQGLLCHLYKEIKKNAKDFDVLSLKYFIAQVKDGVQG